jgi:hypothetical protein
MDYETFLTRIIDDGIAAARADYANDEDKREGSVEGFEACRGKAPLDILKLLTEAGAATLRAMREDDTHYWRIRCREAEIEWVANCVSAILINMGSAPLASHLPTARAVMKAAEVFGVSRPS